MGCLQPGLPQPTMIPSSWKLIIIDLKDCFFTIDLQPKDREKIAFSIPSINNQEPMKQYQWTVLPQGMLNSPTFCQHFVNQPLSKLRTMFPTAIIIHLFFHKNKLMNYLHLIKKFYYNMV
jgi:hypothetical protein